MSAEESLYFIALVPSEPLRSRAWALKEHMRDVYGSKASLNSPPHITLHMPFKLKQSRERAVLEGLQDLAEGYHTFEIELNGFGAFPPRVIFLDIAPNNTLGRLFNDVQDSMHRGFNIENPEYRKRSFHPHMTLASRDLSKSAFEEAWSVYKEEDFHDGWQVQGITLLKHKGGQWEELALAHFANAVLEEEEI